ncbi:TIGR03862 family flavoprotein [Phenylobacterium immobile]|uniref:TIGR03862 family flavoprotein n=1 Tax=Phenylobacterium immobile TaxID=21 RepID=UPI000AEB7155|nr:TIGR03862 family flavoprotein [Phenylobacterium immobile]
MTVQVAVIGGGPAGLMAAEQASAAGAQVTVYERMPSVGRKLLMAGRGGLNLTHSEALPQFLRRYGPAEDRLQPHIDSFTPEALTAWAKGLGQETFVGTSGRIFPKALKASPLLRAWLARLASQGVAFALRHDWRGWEGSALCFETPDGPRLVEADATILALGGASWPRLGATGAWADRLRDEGVAVAAFAPANSGFNIAWSDIFRDRHAGQALKNVIVGFEGRRSRGDVMVTGYGLEGGPIYALSAHMREALAAGRPALLHIDLMPDRKLSAVTGLLAQDDGGASTLTNRLRKVLKLSPVEINILREGHGVALPTAPGALAGAVKDTTLRLTGVQSLARAISTAGGLEFSELDERLMLRRRPGVFVAGEMLDWEAPTGGYLLQAAFATGRAAGQAAADYARA